MVDDATIVELWQHLLRHPRAIKTEGANPVYCRAPLQRGLPSASLEWFLSDVPGSVHQRPFLEPIRRRFRAFDASYGVSFDPRLPMAFLAASFFALRTISKGTKGTR
jgi:hypothetical protein